MHFGRVFAVLAVTSAIVGCSSVGKARRAQSDVAVRSSDGPCDVSSERVDLRGLGLEGLVGFALTNRPDVASARLAVEDAWLALRQLTADSPLLGPCPFSSLHLSGSASYSASSDPARRVASLGSRTRGGGSESLSLDLLVWDFGRYDASARAQTERLVAAELELVRTGYAVFEEVGAAYFGVLEKDALFAVAQSNECEYADHLVQAEERLSAGVAKELDVLRARLDLATAMEATAAAANETVTAGAELMHALGVDASRGSREDVLPPLADPVSLRLRAFADSSDDVASAFAFARTNAPSVRVARARLRAASADVDRAIADLLPEITASVSLEWANPLRYWRWGAGAVESLFQGFRKTTAVDRSVVAMRGAACAVDEAERELSLALERVIAERDNARVALRTAETSVRQAQENLATVREQVGLGEANRVDYTDSVAACTAALGSRVKAYYRAQVAEARLFACLARVPEYDEGYVEEGR